MVPVPKVRAIHATKEHFQTMWVCLAVTAANRALQVLRKKKKDKRSVYRARLDPMRVERDCPRACCALLEERQSTCHETAVATSVKLVAINRRVA